MQSLFLGLPSKDQYDRMFICRQFLFLYRHKIIYKSYAISIMTIPYKYKCCMYLIGPLYMYITVSYNLCSICTHSATKFKLTPLLCTRVQLYMLSTMHPWEKITSQIFITFFNYIYISTTFFFENFFVAIINVGQPNWTYNLLITIPIRATLVIVSINSREIY